MILYENIWKNGNLIDMKQREIFKRTLEFKAPPRIGMTLPAPYPNDLMGVGWRPVKPVGESLEPKGDEAWRRRDEWGVVWASLTNFDKGEVVEAAIPEWSSLDSYVPPDLGRKEDYTEAAKRCAEDTEHFRIGGIPGFTFNVARKLRKLENYLCDLVLERDKIDRLHEIVRTELLKAIDRLAEAGVDGIIFAEDWGTQDRLMVSPEMWREIFKKEARILAGRAREHGLHVLMHSCGKMTDIIEDLIECGVTCFQFDQPRLHGLDVLSERFGGRAAFWCPVDIQTTLQTQDPELIRAEARELIEKLGKFDGGFVAGYYGGNQAIGIDPAVQDHACKAFVEFGQRL